MSTFHSTQCCGLQEVHGIDYNVTNTADYAGKNTVGDARAHMQDLCMLTFFKVSYYTKLYEHKEPVSGKAHMMESLWPGLVHFTTVLNKSGLQENPEKDAAMPGPKLAAFIKENGLGEVVAGPAAFNRVNHVSHLLKTYIWAPDQKALVRWWTLNMPERLQKCFDAKYPGKRAEAQKEMERLQESKRVKEMEEAQAKQEAEALKRPAASSQEVTLLPVKKRLKKRVLSPLTRRRILRKRSTIQKEA